MIVACRRLGGLKRGIGREGEGGSVERYFGIGGGLGGSGGSFWLEIFEERIEGERQRERGLG